MSNLLFSGLKVNDLMRFTGSKGSFFVRQNVKPLLFLCTGTGFAPVKAMVESLLLLKDARQIYIYWGNRNSSDFYSDLPQQWQAENAHIKFAAVLSKPNESWAGAIGYIQNIAFSQLENIHKFDIYACGSQLMINDTKQRLKNLNFDMNNFYCDAFLPPKQMKDM